MNDGMSYIKGQPAKFHSEYKTVAIFRSYIGGKPRMHYYAPINTRTVLEAENLKGIRHAISNYLEGSE